MKDKKLTEKQKLFADEYLIDLNATRAYKAVYKNIKNDETAKAAASRLLTNVNVERYVTKRIKDREKRTEITQDMVINELAKIAFGNGSDYAKVVEKEFQEPVFDEEGNVIDYKLRKCKVVELEETDKLPEEKKAALSSIKETKFGISVERYDKLKALELLGKHLKLFDNKDDNDNKTINLIHTIPRPDKDGDEE